MKKIILSLLALLLHTTWLSAQGVGTWRAYPSYQIATKNVPVGERIYSLCNGNLMAYDLTTSEVTCYDRIHTLSDSKITDIAYSKEARRLIIVYENCNIDLLDDRDEVLNLAQYKNLTLPDKGINDVKIEGALAYIATNTGLLTVDMAEGVFRTGYELGENVTTCCISERYIFAATASKGIFRGDRTLNLQDKRNWENPSTSKPTELYYFGDKVVGFYAGRGLFQAGDDLVFSPLLSLENPTFHGLQDGKLFAGNSRKVVIYESLTSSRTLQMENDFQYLTHHKNEFWGSCGNKGLRAYKEVGEGKPWQESRGAIRPNSPLYDYFYYMDYVGDRLLVAGGSLNYFAKYYEGTAMYYQNGTWTNFENGKEIEDQTNLTYVNLTTIAQDPSNPEHHFVSSARQGLYEFTNGKLTKLHSLHNSELATILPDNARPENYVSTSGLTYDGAGNLWMINNQVDTVLKVLKADGKWVRLYQEDLVGSSACDFLHFGSNGLLWGTSRRMDKRGIFCLDYKGTLEKTSDDKFKLRGTIVNQDGLSYSPDEFLCLAEDKDGHIWVGTTSGPFVITEPDAFLTNNFNYEQIKVPRNDGTNLADYLLVDIIVNTIAVDGANRKWIGTTGNGVYLVSEDGLEMLQHFTKENSPLISNNIQRIAINGRTGEVMIGTDLGLMSYMSDATEPEAELNDENIYAYPNPVEPDYNGPIVVKGLTEDCEVKITSATGQLILSGRSNGGLFTWNGCNRQGRRVASGVYNVITSTADGEEAVVTRIAFIR